MVEACEHNEKVNRLELAVESLVKETAVQVASMSKMEYILQSLGDSMEVLARSQLKIEQHSEQIAVANKRISNNEGDIKELKDNMYGQCAVKTKEMATDKSELHGRIDDELKDMESKSNSKVIFVLAILTFAFGYLVLDDNDNRDKMDKILTAVTINQANITHLMDDFKEHKIGHK